MSNDIIGINIGSKNTVIGTYKNGIFQVILSDTSSRTIPTVISFSDKERTFGDIAFNKNRTNFKTTIIYPNRWLGLKQEYSIFQNYIDILIFFFYVIISTILVYFFIYIFKSTF